MAMKRRVEKVAGVARPCIQVIGLGNPDRGDDGVGLLVADLVRRQLPPSIQVTQLTGDLLSLLDTWRHTDIVILVDAIYSGGKVGTVHRFDLRECTFPSHLSSPSTHTVNLSQVIELARALDISPPQLLVYGIEGAVFEPGSGLSTEVNRAASTVAKAVIQEVGSLESGFSGSQNINHA